VVRGTFSPARAWRPAVVSRLARTLGLAWRTLWPASRISAYRRGLNSRETAEPQGEGHLKWLRSNQTGSPSKRRRRRRASNKNPDHMRTEHQLKAVIAARRKGCQSVRGAAGQALPRSSRPPQRRLKSRRTNAGSAEREASVAGQQENQTRRGLTLRSTGAPTAGHQARAGGTRYSFTGPGLASCRWCPVSSNVRRHT
jgi:hypothetical protein